MWCKTMSDIAIRVEGLSKLYRLGDAEGYRTLRESLTDTFLAPFRRLSNGRSPKREPETIWALKDVSFEVKHGEVIGIIGRNGAGKSTLLKILSRITEPTEGQAEIHGRVGSLLEVGTGFHPELTGRENIFLNGAILGMKKAEILRKFDEIVAFAEVEKFIDTPVKHYSSGMYVRLAFAVAAHMETENLIVDEVLAVGDQKFQDKCLSKMSEVGKQGRTVIYVSHSMPSIQRLCQRALILEKGTVKLDAPPRLAVAEYLSGDVGSDYSASASATRPTITAARVCLEEDTVTLSVDFASPFPLIPILGFVVYDPTGTPVFGTNGRMDSRGVMPTPRTSGRIAVAIPGRFLRPSRYFCSLWLGDAYSDYCALEKVIHFDLNNGDPVELPPEIVGCVNLPVTWTWKEIVPESELQLTGRPELS
jgi:lipopolysaccharide transport system ATP-binding protein